MSLPFNLPQLELTANNSDVTTNIFESSASPVNESLKLLPETDHADVGVKEPEDAVYVIVGRDPIAVAVSVLEDAQAVDSAKANSVPLTFITSILIFTNTALAEFIWSGKSNVEVAEETTINPCCLVNKSVPVKSVTIPFCLKSPTICNGEAGAIVPIPTFVGLVLSSLPKTRE